MKNRRGNKKGKKKNPAGSEARERRNSSRNYRIQQPGSSRSQRHRPGNLRIVATIANITGDVPAVPPLEQSADEPWVVIHANTLHSADLLLDLVAMELNTGPDQVRFGYAWQLNNNAANLDEFRSRLNSRMQAAVKDASKTITSRRKWLNVLKLIVLSGSVCISFLLGRFALDMAQTMVERGLAENIGVGSIFFALELMLCSLIDHVFEMDRDELGGVAENLHHAAKASVKIDVLAGGKVYFISLDTAEIDSDTALRIRQSL